MADHLGYDRHDRAGHGSGNSRNGWTGKTLRTDVGDVRIAVPRDRAGTFLPAVVPKHSRRLTGYDEAVVSLYAKGLTTGDIANHLADVYGSEVSRELVSKVTDAVVEEMARWQNRPLDRCYPVLLIDAIVLKIGDGQVINRPVYVAMGTTVEGERDVLGMCVGPSGGEGAKQWMGMLTELRNAGSPMSASSPATGCVACPTRSPRPGRWQRSKRVWCIWSATACGMPSRPTGPRSQPNSRPSTTRSPVAAAEQRFADFAGQWKAKYPAMIGCGNARGPSSSPSSSSQSRSGN